MVFRGFSNFEKIEESGTKTIPYSPYTDELATNGARSIVESQIDERDETTQKRTIKLRNPLSGKDAYFEHRLNKPIRGLTPLENMLKMLIDNKFDTVKGHESDPEGVSLVSLREVQSELGIAQSSDAKKLMERIGDYLARVRGTFLVEEEDGEGFTIGGIKWYSYYETELTYKRDDAKGLIVDAYLEVKYHKYLTKSMRSNTRIIVPMGVMRTIDMNAYPLTPQMLFFLGQQCKMNNFRKEQGITIRSLLMECGITETELKRNRHPIRGIKRLLNHLQELKEKWHGFDFRVEGVLPTMKPDFKRYSDSILDKKLYFSFPSGYMNMVLQSKNSKAKTIENAIKQSKRKKGRRTKEQEPTTNQPPREITADSFKI